MNVQTIVCNVYHFITCIDFYRTTLAIYMSDVYEKYILKGRTRLKADGETRTNEGVEFLVLNGPKNRPQMLRAREKN